MAVEPAERHDVDGANAVCRLRLDEAGIRLPSVAVATAVERVTGERPGAGELYRAVDPDALDALFADRPDGSSRAGGVVSFGVGECVVTVYADGEVTAATL